MASPTDLQVDLDPPSFLREDGRWEHKFRQSWFKTLAHCPEQARADRAGELPAQESDAACLGTSVHDSIEMCLQDVMAYGAPMSLDDMKSVSQEAFGGYMQLPGFSFVKSTEATSRKHIDMCLEAWYTYVLPDLQPLAVEIPFNLVLFEDDKRVVRVKGTIDCLDVRGPIDWKTAGDAYSRDAWKYERYDVQSTIYTFALRELNMLEEAESYPFEFSVMVKGKVGVASIDTVRVMRNERHWSWLRNKALGAALMVESQMSQWPLGDDDWWCSDKWCPKFASCKGLLLGSTEGKLFR